MVYYLLAAGLFIYLGFLPMNDPGNVWIVLAIVGLIVWAQEKRKGGRNGV